MAFIPKRKEISWTHHAHAKMAFYGLSEQRVMRVIHTPKRVEEGVAPKTVAMMQPASIKTTAGKPASAEKMGEISRREVWSQEIWVMIQDLGRNRKIISAWRYPGMTKPKEIAAIDAMRREYREFLKKGK